MFPNSQQILISGNQDLKNGIPEIRDFVYFICKLLCIFNNALFTMVLNDIKQYQSSVVRLY